MLAAVLAMILALALFGFWVCQKPGEEMGGTLVYQNVWEVRL